MLGPMHEELKKFRGVVSENATRAELQSALEALSRSRSSRGVPDLANLPELLPALRDTLAPLREKAPPRGN